MSCAPFVRELATDHSRSSPRAAITPCDQHVLRRQRQSALICVFKGRDRLMAVGPEIRRFCHGEAGCWIGTLTGSEKTVAVYDVGRAARGCRSLLRCEISVKSLRLLGWRIVISCPRTSSRQTWLACSGDARTILWWYVRMIYRSARIGQLSSTALMLSGFAGVVSPGKVAQALELTLDSPRGTAEVRSGLGGTYAALGGWALVSSQPAAEAAVGAAWLGAAGARLASLALDRPKMSWQFWAYLGAEITFGVTALVSARSRRP